MKGEPSGRILISIIGVALMLWGLGDLALGIYGNRAVAVITSIRSQGAERDDVKPGQYTYQGVTSSSPLMVNKLKGHLQKSKMRCI